MAWFNRQRVDQFGNRIHWEDEVDPEANWPAQFVDIAAGNYHRPWVAAAAGGAATLAYWRGHPISESDLPTEEIYPQGGGGAQYPRKSGSDVVLYDPNNKRTRQEAFPWTSEPRSFERFNSKFQRTDRSASTIENLLNIGEPPRKGRPYGAYQTRKEAFALKRNARNAVDYLTRNKMPFRRTYGRRMGMGYNRRFGAGKYRRAPRSTVGRGFWNNRIAQEKKYWDLPIPNVAGTFGAGTGTTMMYHNTPDQTMLMCLNSPPQGDAANTHDGRKSKNTSIEIKGTIYPGESQTEMSTARTLLVWDKCPNGAVITHAMVIDATITGVTWANGGIQLNNRERFKVLWDSIVDIHADTTATTSPDAKSSRTFKKFFKLKNRTTIFNNDTGGAGQTAIGTSISTGALWLLTVGDATNGVDQQPYLQARSRLRFRD